MLLFAPVFGVVLAIAAASFGIRFRFVFGFIALCVAAFILFIKSQGLS